MSFQWVESLKFTVFQRHRNGNQHYGMWHTVKIAKYLMSQMSPRVSHNSHDATTQICPDDIPGTSPCELMQVDQVQ